MRALRPLYQVAAARGDIGRQRHTNAMTRALARAGALNGIMPAGEVAGDNLL